MVLCDEVKYLALTILLVDCFLPSNCQRENTTHPVVTILQGTLQGINLTTRKNRSVSAFLGIPYAQPPTGNLRFANPVAADGWTGTRNASEDVNVCPQDLGTSYGAEDCLSMNVYTPLLPENTSSTLLPVMVWIHGGGWIGGSHSSARFEPEYLLDADVVLAAPNYRLGPFGFLSTGDEVASGNWALKDQILALRWVQDNIKYFGGDPDQVTLVGQSAGAVSIHLLTLSHATVGLFHKFITQSGSGLVTWAHQSKAASGSCAFELGEYVGCSNDTSASLISCLRGVNISDIVDSYSLFSNPLIWIPTDESDIDGAVLTDSPANIVAAGGVRDLPWISGVVPDEGLTYASAYYMNQHLFSDFLKNVDTRVPELLYLKHQSDSGAAWTEAIKSYYFNNDLTRNASVLLADLARLLGDAYFTYPVHSALQKQLPLVASPQYFYAFNYKGSLSYSFQTFGVTEDHAIVHADDLIYLFPSNSIFSSFNVTRSESDFIMVDTMVELWTSFAINGIPTTTVNNNTVTWDAYSSEDNYLRIGNDSDLGLEIQYSFLKERMEFWAALEAANTGTTSGTATAQPDLLSALLLLISSGAYLTMKVFILE